MRGELAGSLGFRVAANQVKCPEAVDGEPPDMAFSDSVGDFLKAKDIGVEGGTCIHIPHVERDMMQGEKVGHDQTSLPLAHEFLSKMLGVQRSTFSIITRTLQMAGLISRGVIADAVLYVLSTGCQWRALPKDLPPRSTVHG